MAKTVVEFDNVCCRACKRDFIDEDKSEYTQAGAIPESIRKLRDLDSDPTNFEEIFEALECIYSSEDDPEGIAFFYRAVGLNHLANGIVKMDKRCFNCGVATVAESDNVCCKTCKHEFLNDETVKRTPELFIPESIQELRDLDCDPIDIEDVVAALERIIYNEDDPEGAAFIFKALGLTNLAKRMAGKRTHSKEKVLTTPPEKMKKVEEK